MKEPTDKLKIIYSVHRSRYEPDRVVAEWEHVCFQDSLKDAENVINDRLGQTTGDEWYKIEKIYKIVSLF